MSIAGLSTSTRVRPLARSSSRIARSRPSSRTKTNERPSGDQAGRASTPPARVIRRASRLATSISHSQPRAAKAMVRLSGEGAGSVGPCEKVGRLNPSRYTWWDTPATFG
jgi:hypothetical protein